MQQTKSKQLTENGLVLELEKLGFGGVTKRKIAEWRKEALLPDFDSTGSGLGKGKGRVEKVGERPDIVIEQGKWLQRMRAIGISHGNFHLYLWMLDYLIHPEDVRDSLLEPLEYRIKMLESEAKKLQEKWQINERANGIIEDVINDGATAAFSEMNKTPAKQLVMPQEALETIANIFLNPGFNLNLFDLGATFSELEGWSEVNHKYGSELFKDIGENTENNKTNIEVFVFLLQNADFLQHHLSLHQVERAVRECTHETLMEVQADLRIIIKIMMLFAQTTRTVLPHLNPSFEFPYNTDAFLPLLFESAEYFVLADISLRQSGYARLIDDVRNKILDKVEKEFNENVRLELEQSAPVIGQSFSEDIELIENRLTKFVESSPFVHF